MPTSSPRSATPDSIEALEKKTIPQLKAIAKRNGFDLKSSLNKKQIVRTIAQVIGLAPYTPSVVTRLGKNSRPRISKKKLADITKKLGFKRSSSSSRRLGK